MNKEITRRKKGIISEQACWLPSEERSLLAPQHFIHLERSSECNSDIRRRSWEWASEMSSLSPDRQDERDYFENMFADVVVVPKDPRKPREYSVDVSWIMFDWSMCCIHLNPLAWWAYPVVHGKFLGPQTKHPMDPVASPNDDTSSWIFGTILLHW